MALNFGQNTTFGNQATAAKPLGNFSFGGGATSTGFGGAPSTGFGAPSALPSFGAATGQTTFGQAVPFGAASSAAPAFNATATPSFGASPFGAATSTAPAFGAVGSTPAFGATASSAPAFGAPQNPAPAFGTGGSLFGTNTGLTNTATTSQPFSFGGTQTSTAGGTAGGFGNLFGGGTSAAPAATSTGFGGFGTGGAGFGGFGTSLGGATASGPSLFSNTGFGGGLGTNLGQGFGAKPGGGFGTGFGQQQPMQQFQQQEPANPDVAFLHSILNVSIFNDERDAIIARLNHLQALWGTGKSYFSQSNPPIDITNHNILNRFKTVAYCKLPKKDNKMGLVGLVFNKTAAQIKDQQQQLINSLNQIFGKPNLNIVVDNIQQLNDNKCQVVLYVEEKSPTSNEVKRILSTEVSNCLNQPMTKQQLNNNGVERVIPLLPPDEDQLKEYLQNPPKGIDPRMWQQAQEDNPDPQKFIPVPILGNNELKFRIKCQENETEMHSLYLKKIEKDLNDLKQRHMNSAAKIIEYRRRIAKLGHSILKIIVKQETTRKIEEALMPEEELIRSKLENIQSLVIPPNEFKGRLNELVAQMKIHLNQWYDVGMMNEYSLDEDSKEEMKTFLTMQQKAMAALIETVNKDMKALHVISDGINQLAPAKH